VSGSHAVREAFGILLMDTGLRGAINHNDLLAITVNKAVPDHVGEK